MTHVDTLLGVQTSVKTMSNKSHSFHINILINNYVQVPGEILLVFSIFQHRIGKALE